MDAKQRKYQSNQSLYVSGNTARKLAVVPERDRYGYDEQVIRRSNQTQKTKPARKPEVSRGIDFLSMVILTIAIISTLSVCVEYLNVQSGVTQLDKEIIKLENTLADLKDTNNAMKNSLAEAIDLQKIYNIAVGELGMVFPNKNKIITYDKNDVGYVRQYSDIPEVDKESLLDKLLP